MESIIVTIKGITVLCFFILIADFLFGNLWAKIVKNLFKKLSEIMLNGAVIALYHQKVDNMLNFADRNIGHFIPKLIIFLIALFTFGLIYLFGGLAQVIQENKPLAPDFFLLLSVFSFASTISASFCYTITYMVLYLIRNSLGAFVPKYMYLVTLEVLISYLLAPVAYASLVFFEDCPLSKCVSQQVSWLEGGIRMFGMVIGTWPYSVLKVGYEFVYNFQSAVNFFLLILSMMLCVLPTILHIMLLVLDIFRFILKTICERLMDVFDKLVEQPTIMRRFLLGVINVVGATAWIID